MAHEQSETVWDPTTNKWINVYGSGTLNPGRRLPESAAFNDLALAERDARLRSMFHGTTPGQVQAATLPGGEPPRSPGRGPKTMLAAPQAQRAEPLFTGQELARMPPGERFETMSQIDPSVMEAGRRRELGDAVVSAMANSQASHMWEPTLPAIVVYGRRPMEKAAQAELQDMRAGAKVAEENFPSFSSRHTVPPSQQTPATVLLPSRTYYPDEDFPSVGKFRRQGAREASQTGDVHQFDLTRTEPVFSEPKQHMTTAPIGTPQRRWGQGVSVTDPVTGQKLYLGDIEYSVPQSGVVRPENVRAAPNVTFQPGELGWLRRVWHNYMRPEPGDLWFKSGPGKKLGAEQIDYENLGQYSRGPLWRLFMPYESGAVPIKPHRMPTQKPPDVP